MEKVKKLPKGVELDVTDLSKNLVSVNDDEILFKLDQKRIESTEKKLAEAKDKLAKKVYAVQFGNSDVIQKFVNFMNTSAEWREKESLGVIEICKIMAKLQKEGIKENIAYMGALPIEASHYFISKTSGRGLQEAEDFISMLKPFSQALESVKTDASEVQNIEKELAAAQQGIELG